MTIDASAPERAPRRADLTFLRHRAKPVRTVNPAIAEFVAGRASAHAGLPAAPRVDPKHAGPHRISTVRQPPQSGSDSLLDLSSPVPAAQAPPPPRAAPAPPPTPAPAPSGGSDLLDLSAPAPAAPGPPLAGTGGSTSLDLGAVPLSRPPVARPAGGDTSLDLTGASAPAAPPARPRVAPPAARPGSPSPPAAAARYRPPVQVRSRLPEPRTAPGVPTILQAQSPTVTLTRVQSGVGTLTFEAAVADSVGDLRLGAAYQLRSGRSSTIQHQAGRRSAPPGETRRPILLAARPQFERLSLDLRQVDELERLVVYAFSGNGSQLRWGGTLLVTTFGGDRIEMPIEMPPSSRAVAVLASVYNVRGELVLRSEMDLVGTTIMQACRGYGFERISWLDDVTPID